MKCSFDFCLRPGKVLELNSVGFIGIGAELHGCWLAMSAVSIMLVTGAHLTW